MTELMKTFSTDDPALGVNMKYVRCSTDVCQFEVESSLANVAFKDNVNKLIQQLVKEGLPPWMVHKITPEQILEYTNQHDTGYIIIKFRSK